MEGHRNAVHELEQYRIDATARAESLQRQVSELQAALDAATPAATEAVARQLMGADECYEDGGDQDMSTDVIDHALESAPAPAPAPAPSPAHTPAHASGHGHATSCDVASMKTREA